MPLPLENDLYDLHLYQAVTEMDHQLMDQADPAVDVPVTAHVAFRRHAGKAAAPSLQLRLIFQREEGIHVRDPGLFEPGLAHEGRPPLIAGIKGQHSPREMFCHGLKEFFHIRCPEIIENT